MGCNCGGKKVRIKPRNSNSGNKSNSNAGSGNSGTNSGNADRSIKPAMPKDNKGR